MRAVALIEFVENAGLILLGDDRAFVVDGEKYAARFLHEAYLNEPAARAKFYGVVDEVCPHALQKTLVAGKIHGVEVYVEVDLFFRPSALERQNALAHLLVEAEARAPGTNGLAVELAQQQNIARKGGEAARIEEDLVDILRLLLARLLMLLQERGIALDGADGRFEFVRNVGDEVGLQRFGGIQLADHEIEVVVNVADVTKDALGLHVNVEVAAGDLLHAVRKAGDGREERDGEARCRGAAEQQRENKHPDEHRHIDAEMLQPPACERGQKRHDDKACHADEEELHADIKKSIAALFHERTTL